MAKEVSIIKTLEVMEPEITKALPKHIPSEKFIRTLMTAYNSNDKIQACDRRSVLAAAMKAATDGLMLDGREAAIVPFGKEAVYMPMVAGIIKKVINAGRIATITAQIVYKKDKFSYDPGAIDGLKHDPDWFGDRGEAIGVYAIARTKEGMATVEVMNETQIDKIKAISRSASSGPWKDWPEEMWKKTVLRRLCKFLPSSSDIDMLFDNDNDNYDLGKADEVEPENKPSGQTRASEVIMGEDANIKDAEIVDHKSEPEASPI